MRTPRISPLKVRAPALALGKRNRGIPKDYWPTVRRRWRVEPGTLVATPTAAAAAITPQATAQYDSSTRPFISTSESDSSAAYTGNLFATQRVAPYADPSAAARSPTRWRSPSTAWWGPRTCARSSRRPAVPETVILEITATHPDPEVAAQVAQAYAEQLQDLIRELETPQGESMAPIKATIVDDAEISDAAGLPAAGPQPRPGGRPGPPAGHWPGRRAGAAGHVLQSPATTSRTSRTHLILGNIASDEAANLVAARWCSARYPWPRPSGCCAPTCSTSRSTRSRRSS